MGVLSIQKARQIHIERYTQRRNGKLVSVSSYDRSVLRKVFEQMRSGESVDLPDGTRVTRNRDRYEVRAPGVRDRGREAPNVKLAVQAARTTSAESTEPESFGGPVSHSTASAAQAAERDKKKGDDLKSQSPAEIDTKLFPVLDKIAHLEQIVRVAQDEVDNGRKVRGWGGRPNTREPLLDRDKESRLNQIAAAKKELVPLEKEAAPMEAEFKRRGGWKRYVVVPGGHLHKRDCFTLTPGRTMVGQVAEASGLDEKDVVGRFGEVACTHDFPDAPVIPKSERNREKREKKQRERDAKKKDKAFRAADRAEKLIAKTEKYLSDRNMTWEKLYAMPDSGPGSAYGWTSDAPSQVSDLILDTVKAHRGERTWGKDPHEVIEEAKTLGWKSQTEAKDAEAEAEAERSSPEALEDSRREFIERLWREGKLDAAYEDGEITQDEYDAEKQKDAIAAEEFGGPPPLKDGRPGPTGHGYAEAQAKRDAEREAERKKSEFREGDVVFWNLPEEEQVYYDVPDETGEDVNHYTLESIKGEVVRGLYTGKADMGPSVYIKIDSSNLLPRNAEVSGYGGTAFQAPESGEHLVPKDQLENLSARDRKPKAAPADDDQSASAVAERKRQAAKFKPGDKVQSSAAANPAHVYTVQSINDQGEVELDDMWIAQPHELTKITFIDVSAQREKKKEERRAERKRRREQGLQWKKDKELAGGATAYRLGETKYYVAATTDDRWETPEGDIEGAGVEWVVATGDENLQFFDTLREAKADAESRELRDRKEAERNKPPEAEKPKGVTVEKTPNGKFVYRDASGKKLRRTQHGDYTHVVFDSSGNALAFTRDHNKAVRRANRVGGHMERVQGGESMQPDPEEKGNWATVGPKDDKLKVRTVGPTYGPGTKFEVEGHGVIEAKSPMDAYNKIRSTGRERSKQQLDQQKRQATARQLAAMKRYVDDGGRGWLESASGKGDPYETDYDADPMGNKMRGDVANSLLRIEDDGTAVFSGGLKPPSGTETNAIFKVSPEGRIQVLLAHYMSGEYTEEYHG